MFLKDLLNILSQEVERLNQILSQLVKEKGTNKDVAKPLGITPQALGKYMKGRKLPLALVTKWKDVYGEDLMQLAGLSEKQKVPRETKGNQSFWDEIREGDYIGMHKRVWTQHELTMATHRELLKDLVKKLTNSGSDQ